MGGKKNYFGGKHRDCLLFDPSKLKVRFDPQRPEDQAIDENTVWSILQHGVQEPLIIARDGEELYVVAGRRRRLHAIEANRRRGGEEPILVPCVWARGDEADLAEKAVIENFHRKSPSAIGTAKAMQQLFNQGRDEERLRKIFGFASVNSVKGYLALLDCSVAVQKWVEAGGAVSVAVKLSKMSKEEQTLTLEKMIAAGATKGSRASKAAEKKGDVEPKLQRVTPKERRRVLDALSSISYIDKTEVVHAAIAALRFVNGDLNAFKAWGDINQLVDDALNPKPKEKKAKKAKNGVAEKSAEAAP